MRFTFFVFYVMYYNIKICKPQDVDLTRIFICNKSHESTK